MTDNASPTILTASHQFAELGSKLRSEIERKSKIDVREEGLVALAGPNDTLQIIASPEFWLGFLVFASGNFVSGFFNSLGEGAKQWLIALLKSNKQLPLKRFTTDPPPDYVQTLNSVRDRQGTVIMGLPHDRFCFKRNIGVNVLPSFRDSLTELDIYRTAFSLAKIGPAIADCLGTYPDLQFHTYSSNPDVSQMIECLGDGSAFTILIGSLENSATVKIVIKISYDAFTDEIRISKRDPLDMSGVYL